MANPQSDILSELSNEVLIGELLRRLRSYEAKIGALQAENAQLKSQLQSEPVLNPVAIVCHVWPQFGYTQPTINKISLVFPTVEDIEQFDERLGQMKSSLQLSGRAANFNFAEYQGYSIAVVYNNSTLEDIENFGVFTLKQLAQLRSILPTLNDLPLIFCDSVAKKVFKPSMALKTYGDIDKVRDVSFSSSDVADAKAGYSATHFQRPQRLPGNESEAKREVKRLVS